MVFYLKDVHVIIWCDYVPLCKFIYSVTNNDKVNNWPKELHAINPYIDFECMKGKENVTASSLSRL